MNEFKPLPNLPPPAATTGVIGWARANLFPTPFSSALTVLGIYFLYITLVPFLDWAVFSADWLGTDKSACVSGGACWAFVTARLDFFIYGFYPASEVWRLDICIALFILSFAPQFFDTFPYKKNLGIFSLTVFPVVCYVLISGGWFGLEEVSTEKWGGLSLTLMLAYVGIVAALPIGVVLALGRRSQLPVIRTFCISFIELWRGVPLISVLFMSSVMLPLFLPEGMNFDKLLRALIGITMFQSAYMAEVVRGGLQAIPNGQHEAASALGLGYWKSMRLVILPQALKLVIPGIVNTFIALFKDTTLVLIIGLFEVLAAVEAVVRGTQWRGLTFEGYIFVGLCFWVFCFGISRYSQKLEQKLNTGHKR
jgi:general L-amino acid transport system permease protein